MSESKTELKQTCPSLLTLRRFLDDVLDTNASNDIEGHITTCRLCQKELEGLLGSKPDALAELSSSPRKTKAPERPPHLDGYEVLSHIAAGGMGVVWRLADRQFQRTLAIKVIKSDSARDPEMVQRFIAEAQILGQLTHPFIVPVHTMGKLNDGRPYYTMKLVEGQTLAEELAARPDPAYNRMNFVQMFSNLCQAVAFAHSQGIIHRDLKPINVMVCSVHKDYCDVQLMDWGLAKRLGDPTDPCSQTESEANATTIVEATQQVKDVTQNGRIMGTLAYMSAEQARGLVAEIDRRADVFGLGAILCEILTGQPPYLGQSRPVQQQQAADADLSDAWERLQNCGADPELIQLAQRCLAPNKADRPSDAGEVAQAVAGYLASVQERLEQERLERERQRVRAIEEGKRRRVWLGLAAAVLIFVGLLTAAGFYWFSERALQRRDAAQLLEQAEGQLRGSRFAEANALLKQVRGRLGPGGPNDLEQRLVRLVDELDLVYKLDKIRVQRSVRQLREHEYFAVYRDYETTFAQKGFHFRGSNMDELYKQMTGSNVIEPIVAALDDWTWVCEVLRRKQPSPERVNTLQARRDQLLELACRLDPDSQLRDKIRDPNSWKDRKRLQQLAEAARETDLPAGLIRLLSDILWEEHLDAEGLLRTAQARHPDDFWLNFQLSRLLNKKQEVSSAQGEKDRAEALRFLQAALALRPNNSDVLTAMGTALSFVEKNYEAAIHYLRLAIALDDRNSHAHNNLGTCLRDCGQQKEAMKYFRMALEIDPNNVMAHLNLGSELANLDYLKDAIPHFEKAAQISPNEVSVYYRYGHVLQEHGYLAKAETQYRKALALKSYSWPPRSWIHNNLANILALRRQFKEAEFHYRQAMEDKRHALSRTNLGTLLERSQSNFTRAVELHREALLIHPDLQLAQVNLRRAERLVKFGPMLPDVLEQRTKPSSANEYLGLAEMCYLKNQYADSVRFYTKAFQLDPTLLNLFPHRYDAACAAILAAKSAPGKIVPARLETDRRQQALTWLWAELDALCATAAKDPEERQKIPRTLRLWRFYPDLATIRDPQELALLPESERLAWEEFWARVDAVLKEPAGPHR